MKKLFYLLLVLVFLALPVGSVYAQSNTTLEGRVIIGQDFTLKSGETLNGDLVVIGGQAVIEQGAIVNGNIVIIGGSLQLDGQASGDAVIIGGLATLGAKATLAGDLVTLGGSLQRAESAEIGGNVISNLPAPTVQIPAISGTNPVTLPALRDNFNPIWTVTSILFWSVFLGALAMVLTLFLHPQLDRVANTIVKQPFMAGSLGLLTLFVGLIGGLVLLVTLVLSPLAVAAAILIVLAWLFGVIALGMEVGDRFTKALHQNWAPVISAGFGTFLLAAVVGAFNTVFCLGPLFSILVGMVGVGAVAMTLFGTRPAMSPVLVAQPPSVSGGGQNLPPAS